VCKDSSCFLSVDIRSGVLIFCVRHFRCRFQDRFAVRSLSKLLSFRHQQGASGGICWFRISVHFATDYVTVILPQPYYRYISPNTFIISLHSSSLPKIQGMPSEGTILITGANGGLGTAFIEKLLHSSSSSSYGLFIVPAFSDNSSAALRSILSASQFPHSILPLELGNLAAVRAFAGDVNSKVASGRFPRIRTLILNAATQTFQGVQYTIDGFEISFAVNYLANFLLVLLLLESMDPENSRIIIISSFTHNPEHPLYCRFANAKTVFQSMMEMARPPESNDDGDKLSAGMRRYARSKLLMLMFMYFPHC
jgi:NAD(P)-dependent dehydrogenase (short-subunit alcohol dehydrogenase family)